MHLFARHVVLYKCKDETQSSRLLWHCSIEMWSISGLHGYETGLNGQTEVQLWEKHHFVGSFSEFSGPRKNPGLNN